MGYLYALLFILSAATTPLDADQFLLANAGISSAGTILLSFERSQLPSRITQLIELETDPAGGIVSFGAKAYSKHTPPFTGVSAAATLSWQLASSVALGYTWNLGKSTFFDEPIQRRLELSYRKYWGGIDHPRDAVFLSVSMF